MVKRNPKSTDLIPTLQVNNYEEGELFAEVEIVELKFDIETKFGDKSIMVFNCEDLKENHQIFLNQISENNLIEKFGNESDNWIGKKVGITVIKNEQTLNAKAFFVT